MSQAIPTSSMTQVYGTDWCEDTRAARDYLDRLSVPYEYVNIEVFPQAAQWVREQNGGKQRTPTIDMGGMVLTEPSEEELRSAIETSRVRDAV